MAIECFYDKPGERGFGGAGWGEAYSEQSA
jgi:hypothetical protein